MKRGFRFKLIASFILLIIIPMTILGFYCYKTAVGIMKSELKSNTLITVKEVSRIVDNYLIGLKDNVKDMATDPDIEQIAKNMELKQHILEKFKKYKENHPDILNAYVATVDKNIIIYPETQLPEGFDPTTRP